MLVHSSQFSLQSYIKKVENPNIGEEILHTLPCKLFFPYLKEIFSL